jgi:hypothetical protein
MITSTGPDDAHRIADDSAFDLRYRSVMINRAAASFWYFSYPLPAEAIARLL